MIPQHSCVMNSIPEGTILPMHTCHPVMTPASLAIMSPGTAFQLVMGSMNQKMCRGVFLSPTEWYVDGVTKPIVVSSNVDLDLRIYPGSHITQTKTPAVWATMSVTRITEAKAFESMVRKIDTRILYEIQRRIPVPVHPVMNVSISLTPPSQFHDVVEKHSRCKYECRSCLRGFTSSKGYNSQVCGDATETFVCALCDKPYKSRARLTNHVTTTHNNRTTTKIAVLHDRDLTPLASQAPIHPSSFRFVETDQFPPLTQVHEEETTSTPTSLHDVAVPSLSDVLPSHFRIVQHSDEVIHVATVVPQQRQPAVYDEDLFDDESVHLITPTEGLTSLEILDIANGWGFGQEFVMTYKEHDSPSTETFESHGMLHRWDYSIAIPGPLAFYPEEGERPNRYCEEPLDCSADCVILSLVPIADTTTFDRKRRAHNRSSQKRSRSATV